MQALDRVESGVIPMPDADINTDQIIPARFMHAARVDYGRYFFHDLRFDADGQPRAGFVLNEPHHKGSRILLAGPNFGCGSSREHAVYTLADFGVRVVLARSFGDIFFINCFKNGVLPIVLDAADATRLEGMLTTAPGARIVVDLQHQSITLPDGTALHFVVDAFHKACLLSGTEEIDFTLGLQHEITRFEQRTHQPPTQTINA